MKFKKISDYMLLDHAKIVDLLNEIEKGDHPSFDAFCKFEWHLQKHIFLEEKAVYNFYKIYNDKEMGSQFFEKLSKQHTVILELLNKITTDSFPKGNVNFTKLKRLLTTHKNFEEMEVYPNIDKNIDNKIRKEIIERIIELTE
jgi:hypothetical protein